jgi:hypothetical protein
MSKADASSNFDPNTPAAAALEAITSAGARAEDLVLAWRDGKNAAALLEVAEAGSGPSRKAAKRALAVLKSRGVAIPERKTIARLSSAEEESLEAYMTAPDGGLNVLFVLARFPKARRGKAVFTVLNDGIGLLNIRISEIAQSSLKSEVKRIAGERARLCSVPVEWAQARIAAAKAKNLESKVPLPLGMDSAADLLAGKATADQGHPFDDEGLVLADEDASALAVGSGGLHFLPEFAPWMPSQGAVMSMLAEVGQTLVPGEKPEENELSDKLMTAMKAATDRYFTPQLRERVVLAMKDAALVVLSREGEQKALEVAAAILAVEKCGLVTNPPHEVPFLRAFFEKAIQIMMAQNNGQLRIPVPQAQPANG